MNARFRDLVFNLSHLTIAMMMIMAIYVHLHSNVPAEVLPMENKPPFMPIFFLLIVSANFFLYRKRYDPNIAKNDPITPRINPNIPKNDPITLKINPNIPKINPNIPKIDPRVPKNSLHTLKNDPHTSKKNLQNPIIKP